VETFFDILTLFYWIPPINKKNLVVEQKCIEKRPGLDDIAKMRYYLLKVSSTVIQQNTMKPEEAFVVIKYLRDNIGRDDMCHDVMEIYSPLLSNYFERARCTISMTSSAELSTFVALWDTHAIIHVPSKDRYNRVSVPLFLAHSRSSVVRQWKKIWATLNVEEEDDNNIKWRGILL
jgi:hypothetical protein